MISGRFWSELEQFGAAIALEEGTRQTSYAELAAQCDAFAAQLPADRQLIAIQACNRIEAVVAYLACLRAGHPVILMNPESLEDGRILSTYQPNWIFRFSGNAWQLQSRPDAPAAPLAGELAVLLSTSGTTGAPKLVKLSAGNIASNASAIAEYLALGPDERAITTLNFFYSYGMAVLNSHLAVGARIILTDASVTSGEFWDLFTGRGCTSLALVPYHFDLLDRSGFADRALPSLRYITQAGGRLHPDRLQRFASLAEMRGWRLFVMYGQTEASPRMSYVPPEDLLDNLESIGQPVPGGEIVLVDEAGSEITEAGRAGELVYRGPNVMMGYAETRADLAKDKDTFELRTGDMAERQENGYFHIVGRLKRFIKLYGLRINLDDLEARLNRAGFPVYCTGTDEVLAVFHEAALSESLLLDMITTTWGIQRPDIAVRKLKEIPLLPSGKIDYASLKAQIEDRRKRGRPRSVRSAFEDAFGREVDADNTFITLGGDSLLYLHLSLSIERILGYVPAEWEKKPIGELEGLSRRETRRMTIPMDTLARCIAIMGVLTSHLGTLGRWEMGGGAISLMFLSGISLARIQSGRLADGKILQFLRSSLLRIVVIYYLLISIIFLALPQQFRGQEISWYLFYANWNFRWDSLYTFWFVCAYVQLLAFVALLWAVPPLRHFFRERREEFGYFLLAIGLGCAYWADTGVPDNFFFTNTLAIGYLIALGWCTYYAGTALKKALLSGVFLACIALFWRHEPLQFKLFFTAIVLSSIWIRQIQLPRPVALVTVVVASASFYVYILHLFPVKGFEYLGWHESLPRLVYWVLGVSACLAIGILADRAGPSVEAGLKALFRWRHRPAVTAEKAEAPPEKV